MTRFAKPAAVIAAAVSIAFAGPAAAQQASYCNGNLKANSFYSNVLSNGRTADVEYFGQFQNQDPNRRAMRATMSSITFITFGNIRFPVLRPIASFDLGPYEQKTIKVLAVHTQNSGGTGAPTPQHVGNNIRFTCSFM